METATPETNGAASSNARSRITHDLEAEVERGRARQTELRDELNEVNAELKAFEQALARLRGEPLRQPGQPDASGQAAPRVRGVGTRISTERLEEVKAAVLRFASEHDEFRQIDIRTMPGSPVPSSGGAASAFEILRQAGVIRLARRSGNQKFFRLTTEARRELQA
jgi:hypothetical protein